MITSKRKILAAVAVAGVVAAGGSAFTNSNTLPVTSAGSGESAIDAYTTIDVVYNPDSGDPTLLDNVTFTTRNAANSADLAADFVAIRLTGTGAGGTWYKSDDLRVTAPDPDVSSCTSADGVDPGTEGDGIDWTCDVSGATPLETVADADNLTVVAIANS